MSASAPTISPRRRNLLFAAVLVLSGALYAPWLSHGFLWDDFVQITENPSVRVGVPLLQYFTDRTTTSIRSDYNERIYRPLRNVAFRWVWRASDLLRSHRTVVFHGLNLLLYLAGGVLVWQLCFRLARDELASLVAAGLWLLLPVHAEDVLYASALGDLLSFDLQLVGLLLALRAIDADPGRTLWPSAGALLAFVVATFVKEMAITSLVIIPIFVFSERRALLLAPARRRRLIALIALHALLGFAYLTLRTAILKRVGQEDVRLSETLWGVADAPWLLLKYLKVALLPLGHAPDYGSKTPTNLTLILCALGGLPLFVWCNLRPERGVRFGAWLYVAALGPVLHLVPLWTMMADRFLLVPSVGLAVMGAGLLARSEPRRRPLYLSLCAVLAIAWAGGTAIEARRFQSDESLFAYGVEEVPDSGLSHHNLGLMLLRRGETARAIEHLMKAERLGRRDPRLYHHLAGAFDAAGRYDEAARATARAIELKPDYGNAYAQRAALERRRGDFEAAEQSLAIASRLEGTKTAVERERAALLVASGRLDEAYQMYRDLAEVTASDPVLWQHAAECAMHLGRVDDARAAAERCYALNPTLPACLALREPVQAGPASAQ